MADTTQPESGKEAPASRPESMIDRKQTGCCEEAQADGVNCTTPSNNCETCGRSVVDFSRHTCEKKTD